MASVQNSADASRETSQKNDPLVADVFIHLSGQPDWFNIYKAYELMRKDVNHRLGGSTEAADGLAFKKGAGSFSTQRKCLSTRLSSAYQLDSPPIVQPPCVAQAKRAPHSSGLDRWQEETMTLKWKTTSKDDEQETKTGIDESKPGAKYTILHPHAGSTFHVDFEKHGARSPLGTGDSWDAAQKIANDHARRNIL